MSVDYTNTYWNGKGRYQETANLLMQLIPFTGEVSTPKLETFRKAVNCYYDLYNNGLWNRAKEFVTIFGFDPFVESSDPDDILDQELVELTEDKMNVFVILAAKEQELI